MEIIYLIPTVIALYGMYVITRAGVKRIEDLKAENAKIAKNQKIKPILNNKEIYAVNQQKGEEYEKYVGKQYEEKGYSVEYRGLEKGKLDGGIDLIAKKENETILIQCKYWTGNSQLKKIHAEKFHSNCTTYMEKNNLDVKCIMAIPSKESINYGAEVFFRQNSPQYRYEIIKYKIL